MGQWVLLLSAGAFAAVCFLEIKRRDVAAATANMLSEIGRSKAALANTPEEPAALQAELARLQSRLETLRAQESIARAARNAKAEEEARLRKTFQQMEAGLSVVPQTSAEFASRIARSLIVCASERVNATRDVKSGNTATQAEARLVLVRSVGAIRQMERDLPKFSEFMTKVIAQFYDLGEDARKEAGTIIYAGFDQMRRNAVSSLDRPEPGSDRWEIRSLEWETARDSAVERIAQSIRSIIPETHPYSPWLPSVLSMSSGLRGAVNVDEANPAKKPAITVGLPLSPVKN
jgi:hypothetical protein